MKWIKIALLAVVVIEVLVLVMFRSGIDWYWSVLLTACDHQENKPVENNSRRSQSTVSVGISCDEKLRELIIGTWTGKEGRMIYEVTFGADGSWQTKMMSLWHPDMLSSVDVKRTYPTNEWRFSSSGAWKIRDGYLIESTTNRAPGSLTNGLPLGFTVQAKIIRLDDDLLVEDLSELACPVMPDRITWERKR